MKHDVVNAKTSNQTTHRRGVETLGILDIMTPLEALEMLFRGRCEAVERLAKEDKNENYQNLWDAQTFEMCINVLRTKELLTESGE